MSMTLQSLLIPSNGYIFRITHRDNVPFILEHGVHCRSASTLDPAFVEIGHPGIIEARKTEVVATGPGGLLADYIPFYFTPCSPMLYNIVTGYNGVRQRDRAEIVILMSSLGVLQRLGIPVVFADRNARLSRAVKWASEDPRHGELYQGLPWQAWQDRDFRHDPNEPARKERYQAEALVHRWLPVDGLNAIITFDTDTHAAVSSAVAAASLSLPVAVRSHWYP